MHFTLLKIDNRHAPPVRRWARSLSALQQQAQESLQGYVKR
jgi:hypothetical protein